MKIWVVGRGYPTPANKMWGSFELEQAKLLARKGHEVSYIALTLSFFSRKDPRGARHFRDENVEVFAYSHLYFPGKLGIYWKGYESRCWRRLFNDAEQNGGLPDVIHIHYPAMLSDVDVTEEYRRRGVKIFVTEHWSRVLIGTLKAHERARLQYYAQNAACFACVSEILAQAVRKTVRISVPMNVIPNIVSPVFFEAGADSKPDGVTFVAIGRLVALKQFDVVITQFLKAFQGRKDVSLKIIGAGPERKKLEALCKGSEQISFTGALPLKNVAVEMAAADILVSFSRYETFAAPVPEAWACGKLAIVSDKSGVAAYVKENLGMVVPAGEPEMLGEAMKKLASEAASRSPERISAYAAENFNDEAIIRKLESMYTQN